MPAPTHLLDGGVVRHIERRAQPGKEMKWFVTSLLVTACACVQACGAAAGPLDTAGNTAKIEPRLLERTERKTPPVDVFAAPSALAHWVNRHARHRLEVSVKLNR